MGKIAANEEYPFSPSDLAEVFGIPLDVQRDRRRRGAMPKEDVPGFCIRDRRGYWHFSVDGALKLSAVQDLAKAGLELLVAMRAVEAAWPSVQMEMGRPEGAPRDPAFRRFVLIEPVEVAEVLELASRPEGASDLLGGVRISALAGIDPTDKPRGLLFRVIDVLAMVDGLAEAMRKVPPEKMPGLQLLEGDHG